MSENKPQPASVAKALIVNERNEVLILTAGEYKARPDKSFKPDLPGGLVDPGESEIQAVVREIGEETGIAVGSDYAKLVYAHTELSPDKSLSVTKCLYLIFLDDTPDVTLSWEHVSYEWVPISKIGKEVKLRGFYAEAADYCLEIGLLHV